MTNTHTLTNDYKDRDDYGRTLYRVRRNTEYGTRVVIVVLPKSWVDHNPGKGRYLVNDWQIDVPYGPLEAVPGKLTHCRTLKEARALAHGKVLAGIAAEQS